MLEMMMLVVIAGVLLIAVIAVVAAYLFASHTDKLIEDKKRKSKNWVDKEERS